MYRNFGITSLRSAERTKYADLPLNVTANKEQEPN